ncbi:DedA family protein [Pelagibaculum spongiae]|uniref:VTT domain-containing protein n=1 Tax=Pelagibaculum spongiae TaxID=2080658 RepID=A0A2V1H0V8_9GAMM|nr:DedA family protein [Pelagibaculum spongiae]PVZ72113.1 hypothetical protein DC094_03605 [Pelagibaculum spongiae]
MQQVLDGFLNWLLLYPHLAGAVAFIIAASESLVIIGLLIPGMVLMLGLGALAGSQVVPLQTLLIFAFIGAIVGDGLSYILGRYCHEWLTQVWPLNKHPQLLHRAENFFQRHGGMSIFVGRFIGPLRPLVPFVAGAMEMPSGRFLLANISSAAIWAPGVLLPGYLLGEAIGELNGPLQSLMRGLIIGLCLLVAIIWLVSWIASKLSRSTKFKLASGLLLVTGLACSLPLIISSQQSRISWFGLPAEAFHLQIKASVKSAAYTDLSSSSNMLSRWLTEADWQPLQSNLATLLRRIEQTGPLNNQPILPYFHQMDLPQIWQKDLPSTSNGINPEQAQDTRYLLLLWPKNNPDQAIPALLLEQRLINGKLEIYRLEKAMNLIHQLPAKQRNILGNGQVELTITK